jgi:hypothetical protein
MEKIFGPRITQTNAPTNPNAQNPTNNLQAPPNNVPATTNQTAPNGVVPEEGATPPKEPESPLKEFENLWQPTKPEESNATPPENQLTTEKFMEAAGKVDFTKVLDNETLQKIAAGGQDAVQAFAQALNKTSQQVFGQATAVSQKLIERATAQTRDDLLAQIPGLIRKQAAGDSLMSENPAFSNPALQPVVTALQQQFTEKYPKASASEIKKMTMEYLSGAANIINPPKPATQEAGTGKDENWDKYFS